MRWTPDMDRALMAARAADSVGSWSSIAAKAAEALGTPITADMARNRLSRIDELIDLEKNGIVDPPALEVPAAPLDRYVGFETIFWDLETTGLTAIMGRLLSYSHADGFGRVTTLEIGDFPGTTPIDDSRLAVAVRDELEKADTWVTWNGKLFDVPFLNARLLKAGERPVRGDVKHVDLMYFAAPPFVRIGSRKLDNVSKFIQSPNRKTEIDWDTWALAGMGDRAAMAEVVVHNRADVLVTRDAFAHLRPHIRNVHR